MIPTRVRRALECIAHEDEYRSIEHCEKCPYSASVSCYAQAAREALEYMQKVEDLQRLTPPDNDRVRTGYLYTVYDKISNTTICKDKPARECALILGYVSKQGFCDLYKKCARGDDRGFEITRRKGNITHGYKKRKKPLKQPIMSYTIKALNGDVLHENITSLEAAKVLDVSVTTLYKRMGKHMQGKAKESMLYHGRIIERRPAVKGEKK